MLQAFGCKLLDSGSTTAAKGRQWQITQKDPIGKARISQEADRLGRQGEMTREHVLKQKQETKNPASAPQRLLRDTSHEFRHEFSPWRSS